MASAAAALLSLVAADARAGELELELTAADFDLSAESERAVSRILTRMYGTYEAWFAVVLPQRLNLPVTLIDSQPAYQRAASAAMGKVGHTLGFFDRRSGAATVWHGQGDVAMRGTLVHETSHHLLSVGGLAGVPMWVNEGLAELFETAQVDGNAVYLVPNADTVRYLDGRTRPRAMALISLDAAAWAALGPTPWSHPEYPYGWALCAFLASTEPGRRTLSDVMLSTAPTREQGQAAVEAVARSYPGGGDALDRAFAEWRPGRIQLPIRSSNGQADGWAKCPDGSLVRVDAGGKCGQWVAGPDGVMRYVEQKPVP